MTNREIKEIILRNIHMVEDFGTNATATMSVTDCMKHGFVFIQDGMPSPFDYEIANLAIDSIGVDCRKFNETFHKSFETVATEDIDALVMQQLMHYFSTYGLEGIGFKAMPYIPVEELHLPEGFPEHIVPIIVAPHDAICERYTEYFCNIVKPSARQVQDFRSTIEEYFIAAYYNKLQSFELNIIACDIFRVVPTNPDQFMRYLVYKTTGNTMLVKNNRLINQIKASVQANCPSINYAKMFSDAGLANIASVFYRYKNIILAYKQANGCASLINKIRRLADTYHKPLSDVCVQNYWKIYHEGRFEDANNILKNASFADLIKILGYGIMMNTANSNAVTARVYNIRNGKTFVADKTQSTKYYNVLNVAQYMIRKCNLTGKTFYIPEYMNYAYPTSEKQMVGSIPWGTSIDFNDNAYAFGISWDNVNKNRVDLDLHMHGEGNTNYGWNGNYRNNERSILFSGDMTDATNGAAEAFYFKPDTSKYILDISKFAGPNEVPFKFFISTKQPKDRSANYTCDPAECLFNPIPMKFMDTDSCTFNLGYVTKNKFVFYGGSLSNSIGGNSQYYDSYLKAMDVKLDSFVHLDQVITICGGIVTHKVEDLYDENHNLKTGCIDLSPENLMIDTITSIFKV